MGKDQNAVGKQEVKTPVELSVPLPQPEQPVTRGRPEWVCFVSKEAGKASNEKQRPSHEVPPHRCCESFGALPVPCRAGLLEALALLLAEAHRVRGLRSISCSCPVRRVQ